MLKQSKEKVVVTDLEAERLFVFAQVLIFVTKAFPMNKSYFD